MSPKLLFVTLGFCPALMMISTAIGAPSTVQLSGWEHVATLFPGGGAGRDAFELVASVPGWPRDLTGRFDLRIELPGGRVETQPLQVQAGDLPRRLPIFVPAASVRNQHPQAVLVRLTLVDPTRNAALSNALVATIDDFPRPRPEGVETARGPFGWGTALAGAAGEAQPLPRPGPEGLRFVRIPASDSGSVFFIASSEVSNAQAARLLPGYDSRAGRSDEFLLEAPTQPAIGLTPSSAQTLLAQLSRRDPSGLSYRLPTVQEWQRAARAGRSTPFWWGDQAPHPEGANLLGSEPGLAEDTTAPTLPQTPRNSEENPGQFQANPWHLFHTFGNVAEWATSSSQAFVRMGGHFRTEPSELGTEVEVVDANSTGPDRYVGVRPVLELDSKIGTALVQKALGADARLAKLRAHFDPARATVTLDGSLTEPAWRSLADRRLAALWFVAAVENRVETPTIKPGQLARLGGLAGPVRRITPLGRWFDEIPLEVRWAEALPVAGSEWWVNIYLPGGGHVSHRMAVSEPDSSRRLIALVERSRTASSGSTTGEARVSVALSLGGEAANPTDPRVVSNLVSVQWPLK